MHQRSASQYRHSRHACIRLERSYQKSAEFSPAVESERDQPAVSLSCSQWRWALFFCLRCANHHTFCVIKHANYTIFLWITSDRGILQHLLHTCQARPPTGTWLC